MTASIFIHNGADLARLIVFGSTTESRTLDFKKDFGHRLTPKGDPRRAELRREGRKETARDIAQFANTIGGCLLVGVDETANARTGTKIAKGAQPLHDVDDLRRWVEDSAAEFLVPSTTNFEFEAMSHGDGAVVAVNVPASRHLVTVWDRQTHASEFVRRTNHGKAYMNPDEMERHLMNGSRAAYLKLLAVVAKSTVNEVKVSDGYWLQHFGERPERWTPVGPVQLDVTDADSFLLSVPASHGIPCIRIPYGLAEEAWSGVDGKIQLLLTKRLVLRANVLELFPFH